MTRPFVHDTWAALSYKEALGPGLGRPPGAPSWVPDDDVRRLVAYRVLAAYRDNVARYYLPEPHVDPVTGRSPDDAADKWREYGHAGLLVNQARSLLLGEEQTIVVPDAAPPDDGKQPAPDAARALRAKEWLDQWATDEHLRLKLLEVEEYVVGEGDGVLTVGWDDDTNRPRMRVFNAGFYFPDLRDDPDGFPTTVHIAYELEEDDGRTFLRRFTWQLIPLVSKPVTFDEATGEPVEEFEATRRYPWQEAGEPDSTKTVLYSEMWFDLSKLRAGANVYTLSEFSSGFAPERSTVNQDLRVDFLPVLHIPNDAAGSKHFGRSVLLLVAQVLDDLAATDSDLQSNSALVGSTPTVVKGGGSPALQAGPGAQWNVPAGGSIAMLDTSKNLDAHLKYVDHLLDVLSVNSRLASALLGRIKPNEVPSGYAFELGFVATISLIREMRLVRDMKYALLCKMALRFAQAAEVLEAGPTPAAAIALGAYLPSDKATAVTTVNSLLTAEAISTLTAVEILMQAGFPIEDAEEEVNRIRAESFDKAVKLADATGDDDAVRQFLQLPPRATLPPVAVPTGAQQ